MFILENIFKCRLEAGGFGRGRGAGDGRGSRPAGGFGGGSGGDDEFSRGRKFSADDLQLLLLALLLDAPRHGYELIRMLETRSNGFYVPSPGMVYPALTYLGEIGYTSVLAEGSRKSYSLTDSGRTQVAANHERIEVLWAKLNFLGKKMGMVRRALAGEDAEGNQGGALPIKELMEARFKLKQHLFALGCSSTDEQLRIAKILERALAEILEPTQTPKDH